MDSYSAASSQTTQSTNTSDYSYPILFQLQPGSLSEAKSDAAATTLESPYVRQKTTIQAQVMKRVRMALALLGILTIVLVIFVLSFYLPSPKNLGSDFSNKCVKTINSLKADLDANVIFVNNSFAETSLRIQTNLSQTNSRPSVSTRTAPDISVECGNMLLGISLLKTEDYVKCWNLSFSSSNGDTVENCILFEDSTWYGIGERVYQTWRVNDANIAMSAFVTYDILQGKENKSYGGVIEPYLVSSGGFGILVDRRNSLYMSINNPVVGKLCFKAPSSNQKESLASLNYTICIAENVLQVHKYMVGRFFGRTGEVPDTRLLTSPIWSTWAKYKKNITQENILEFASDIKNHSMPISQLEIDDMYSTHYGDFDFSSAKFSDPKKMIKDLQTMGMRVTIWVYPFANFGSKAITDGKRFWVQVNGMPGVVTWWNGLGAILDTTNDEGVEWFKKRLKNFQSLYGLDGFKFDAGEVRYLPSYHTFNKSIENVNFFTTKYVHLAAGFGGFGEVRVGYGNQDSRVFTRLLDRSSTWGIDNGLKSVVTATLTFGILGYPFVLPDMVGGNAYEGLPDKELYIRWAQLNAFLPSIQFSLAPWDYDDETTNLVKAALDIRSKIAQDILNFSKIAASDNYPIIRPLWWLAPNDKNALINDSEFLVGDRYLVAPVLEKGAKELNVYLIEGKWQEMFGSRKIFFIGKEGLNVLYKVTLSDIVYFIRLD